MNDSIRAKEPFNFFTRLHLSELTGLRASTLNELLDGIKNVPDSSIYHHTHRYLQEHQLLNPEPPNDFAYWVSYTLGEIELGELLASIDIMSYPSLLGLRERIVEILEKYMEKNPTSMTKVCRRYEEFHFIKSISLILPTNIAVNNLKEFSEALKKITVNSIYFHVFEARLRLGRPTNDFSAWIEESLGEKGLASRIARLDPYTHTLEDLRLTMIGLIEKRIGRT